MKTTTTKKKVLFFIPTFPVLTETFIEKEVLKLVERGNIDIEVLSMDGDRDKLNENLKDIVYYKRLNFLNIIPVPIFIFKNFKKFLYVFKKLKNKNTSVITLLYKIIKSCGYALIIKKHEPDLILAHFLSEPSTIGLISSIMLNIPFVISAHARDVTVSAEYVREKIEHSKFILVCNKNARDKIISLNYNVENEKVILQYHGVEVKKLQEVKAKEREDKNIPLIVSIGRLVEKKGHEYLIEASSILKKRGINHLIYIIGPGPLYDNLNKKIESLDISSSVEILGEGKGLPFSDAISILKSADLCVFSGIKTEEGDEDGIPNVIVEAAAMNIPIVASDAGSVSELVTNEDTGILVRSRDAYMLADAIERQIFNRKEAEIMSSNAYKKVSMILDMDKNIIELENKLL